MSPFTESNDSGTDAAERAHAHAVEIVDYH